MARSLTCSESPANTATTMPAKSSMKANTATENADTNSMLNLYIERMPSVSLAPLKYDITGATPIE